MNCSLISICNMAYDNVSASSFQMYSILFYRSWENEIMLTQYFEIFICDVYIWIILANPLFVIKVEKCRQNMSYYILFFVEVLYKFWCIKTSLWFSTVLKLFQANNERTITNSKICSILRKNMRSIVILYLNRYSIKFKIVKIKMFILWYLC